MKILITGGAGFIGSAVIRHIINKTKNSVLNIDMLTYAGNLENLKTISDNERYNFEKIDICDQQKIFDVFLKFKPDAVMHLAAESHVDRSIKSPQKFVETNILGTYSMLEASKKYLHTERSKANIFRFHHISTDEVFGDLDNKSDLFTEDSSYKPSSPYSASKASADHLVRAWGRTYKLPVIITNCSNNYGPYHFPEKLIPLIILNALSYKKIPIYGDGTQIRDWLFVEDHAKALYKVIKYGEIGETYNIGGNNELTNIAVAKNICNILDNLSPPDQNFVKSYHDLIEHIDDRPGHDKRYAIDSTKIKKHLNWEPDETFESGLKKTVEWYIKNQEWCENIKRKHDNFNTNRE